MNIKYKSETKIGLIVIAAFAVFVWGLNYLKGVNLLKPSNHFYVEYTQIDGLVKSSTVNLDGYQVGLVRDISYQYNRPGHIIVDLNLEGKLRLPAGSKAVLTSSLMGSPTITLVLGPQNGTFLKSGDTLMAERQPGLMDELSNGVLADVRHMVQRTDSLLSSVETLVNNGDLNRSLASIEQTAGQLKQISTKLNRSMDQLPGILTNVEDMTAKFSEAGSRINQIDFASLNRTLTQMENLTIKLNSQDNSMGLLLNDKALYMNLSSTASSANELLLDLKASPKRYVHFSLFGSKEKK